MVAQSVICSVAQQVSERRWVESSTDDVVTGSAIRPSVDAARDQAVCGALVGASSASTALFTNGSER